MKKSIFKNRYLITIIIGLLLIFSFQACKKMSDSTPPKENQVAISNPTPTTENTVISPTEKLKQKVSQSASQFAFKFFREISGTSVKKNIVISPASLFYALSIAYNGTDGITMQEMATAMQLKDISLEDLNTVNSWYVKLVSEGAQGITLNIANSLWADKTATIKETFVNDIKKYYDAKVSTLDFNDAKSKDIINAWVKEKTGGKIEKIVEKIPPGVVAYIINAVYFKGIWTQKFDISKTTEEDFNLLDQTKVKVQIMNNSGEYEYYQDQAIQAVKLPYGDGSFSMAVIMPSDIKNFNKFLQNLTNESFMKTVSLMQKMNINLGLPKWRSELKYDDEIKKALTALGMESAFSGGADFSKMQAGLFISKIVQKTFIEVNEEGTEASAATSIEMGKSLTPQMLVNKPFFFAIMDNKNNNILFMGAIINPMK